ncbi:lipopolysaccharide heptosyltransferase I [Cellvibrio japonicus]|nr:lipopolysaccharide heptosyltransferase I [Cellvibrio japonicus]QEI11945.1 lipopolysaccharide heptosyltransferase I [Cellvibrio japonicus]QEI15519.1 lipopolysaccharide heptosyltransferase I [Cellvibrio japonicus]QEI19098.1 lipopolysaccharide heptosyltransferase I [Cellvibrio japonicus]
MRILLVKMSSMGDIFHTFPALSDLKQQHPHVEIDWVVEEGFSEIAAWHPAVTRVIPIQLRRWMKHKGYASWQAFKAWKKNLQLEHYDCVIDAQGLLKSGLISRCANSPVIHGYDKHSARETIAHWFYTNSYAVDTRQHAVERTRQLFGKAFGYQPTPLLNFGIKQQFTHVVKNSRKLVFIIGTSWVTKLWSTSEWQALAQIAIAQGYAVEIIWGSPSEQEIARKIIEQCPLATRPGERMSITAIAEKLVEATGVIGLDTGFSHLAGALETPTIALYGPTSPTKVGLIGPHTLNLQLSPPLDCMPCHKRQCQWLPEKSTDTPACMSQIKAAQAWASLQEKMRAHS